MGGSANTWWVPSNALSLEIRAKVAKSYARNGSSILNSALESRAEGQPHFTDKTAKVKEMK